MADDDIVWDEPPQRHQQSEWFATLNKLKDRPGQTARLFFSNNADKQRAARAAANAANSIRNAARHLGGGWEILSRSVPTGGAGVWAKWPVDEEAEAQQLALSDAEAAKDGLPANPEFDVDQPDLEPF